MTVNLLFKMKTKFSIELNPYLKENLFRRKFLPLKRIQIQSFLKINQNKNVFINSCTGSGKTLAYLIPILQILLKDKELDKKQKNHGAIILTLNKQLCLQIYRQIRLLDPQNKLKVVRTGPISHYSYIVQKLGQASITPAAKAEIEQQIQLNVGKSVKWSKTDILISTPQLLWNILTVNSKFQNLYPKIVAIDQADMLLQLDKNINDYTEKILSQLKYISNIRYLLTASSFPQKMGSPRRQSLSFLSNKFNPLQILVGEQKHKLPQKIELLYIDLQKQKGQTKDDFLIKIIKERKQNKVLIFCNNKDTVLHIVQLIKQKLGLTSIPYFASLSANQRSQALYRFENEGINLLVSTDLGSRGLDFKIPISCVIQYQMAQNIVNFINRAGRTGRNGLDGQIITFIEEKNKQFFNHLQTLQSSNSQFNQLFSRKRSYRKLYKLP